MSEISKLIAEIKSEGILRSGNKLEQLYILAEQMETDYAALQQKLDAMAADIALNGWVACSPEWIDKNGPCSCEAAPRIAFGNIGQHYHPQSFTPATDADLNSVRAEGVDKLGDFAGQQYQLHEGDKAQQKKWKSVVFLCCQYADQLRSGTHDNADKAG